MKKKIIGYTAGVFDLFHIGHLNIIRKAKEHCDYLIVGVTTDEETFRLKNKTPVIPYEERKEIIKALKYVDEVYKESNSNKLHVWEELKYDLIVKGDDWKGRKKWVNYEKEFAKLDVKVQYFEYTKGTSSTILAKTLEKILDD